MPSERDVLHWLAIAQQRRGNVRAWLVEMMGQVMDDDRAAEALADIVIARLEPSAGRPVRPPVPGGPASGRATAAQNLPEPTSPYRFVELNRAVIPAPKAVREAQLDIPLPSGFSGEISVDWVAETPLLIGKENGGVVEPLRLGPTGDYAIPGATLKGLLRAGVEIVTLGRLSQLNREHRYGLRDFMDPFYRDDGHGQSRLAWEKIGAGWLQRQEASPEERRQGLSDYCITPCDKRTVRIRALPKSWFPGTPDDGARHLDWLGRGLAKKYEKAGMGRGPFDFSSKQARWFTGSDDGEAVPADEGTGRLGIYVFSGKLPLPKDKKDQELIDELNVEDGKHDEKQKKKREYVFFDRDDAEPLRVPQRVFEEFKLINSTPSGRGLVPVGSWKELQPVVAAGGRIPVFILGDPASGRFDFGLTRAFKVAHARSVGEVLDAQTGRTHRLGRDVPPDWAEALFGSVLEEDDLLEPSEPRPRRLEGEALPPSVLARKGRVAVGFARAPASTAAPFPPLNKAAISTTMMGPRASFASHYLVGKYKHWSDPGAGLAGRKRYFPRFAGADPAVALDMVVSSRTLPPAQGEGTVSRLRFLVPAAGRRDVRFTGVIRVHNLLAVEVGVLLWVLTHGGAIGGRFRHMIGRAKSFGAGQARVENVRLNLYGHDAAADSLLGSGADVQPFLTAFETAMDEAVRAAGLRGRWAEQVQVDEWLRLSDPDLGQAEWQAGHARYPGAEPATRDGLPGLDMSKGPKAHMKLRQDVGNRDIGKPRWLPVLRRVPVVR